MHQPGDDGAFQQVAPVLGEDDALGWLPHLVPGPADPLQPARHRQRRLHLDDEVHRAHIDAQLQGAGGDERRQAALLEHLLDDQSLLPSQRAVMRPDQVLARQLVELERQPLREPPAVGEHDGAAMAPDELQDARIHRRPDARPLLPCRGRSAGCLLERDGLTETAHVVHGHDHLEQQRLAHPGIHDGHRSRG